MFGMRFTEISDRVWRNDLGLSSAAIIAEEFTISPTAINSVGITGIRRDIAAFTCSSRMPVAESDCSVIAPAQNKNASAILLRTVNVIREIVVDGHVIELSCRLVVPTAPGVACVHTNAGALVAAKNHPLRIIGINPESMIVVAAGSALDGDESFPGVRGAIDG